MSRAYGMSVQIEGIVPRRARCVKRAASREWPFQEWEGDRRTLRSYAESCLAGGEDEDQFADRLAGAIWKANKAFCHVTVEASYLEELPYESHHRGEVAYCTWLRKEQKGKKRRA